MTSPSPVTMTLERGLRVLRASAETALAPVSTPAPVVERLSARLSDELVRIAQSPESKAFCANQSMTVDIADRRQFLGQLPKEDAHWKRIAQLSKES